MDEIPSIVPLGDEALIVQFAGAPTWETGLTVRAAAHRIRALGLTGIVDVVPAYTSLAVYFDPSRQSFDSIARAIGVTVQNLPDETPENQRTVEIPVVYDGPDLDEVAQRTGLSVADVVERHASRTYRAYMSGFAPGFVYLGDLDEALVLPRRTTPRVRVPAGSVAIAAAQTAVYPLETPGGWHIIGSTTAVMFDSRRDPPALVRAGDLGPFRQTRVTITVTAAPPFATIQDLGRTGFRDIGVPVSGVADRDTGLALNALLGNDRNAAMVEWAVAGGALKFDVSATIAIGGANVVATLDGSSLRPMTAVQVAAGAELRVDRFVRGRFLLIGVRGGIDVPLVLGSRSTLLSASLGGLDGRRLRTGDRLRIGDMVCGAIYDHVVKPTAAVSPSAIHVIRGPQAALFDDRAWETLLGAELTVSRASDRTGYRLEGATMSHSGAAALPSEPACVGAVQVPDGGAPIVIMHDGPTLGGYPKIAVIRSSSLSRFAQLAPSNAVRFVLDV